MSGENGLGVSLVERNGARNSQLTYSTTGMRSSLSAEAR